jgi:transcription elongation factor GreA-like protein
MKDSKKTIKKEPTYETRFKVGNAGGPGRPKGRDPRLTDFSKNLTKTLVTKTLSEMLDSTEDEIQEILDSKQEPAIKKAVASVIKCCIENGDYMRLEMLLNRVIGKVRDESFVETKNHDDTLEKVPREKIVQLLRSANE